MFFNVHIAFEFYDFHKKPKFQIYLIFRLLLPAEEAADVTLIKGKDTADVPDRFFRSGKRYFMRFLLRIKRTEANIIGSEHVFHL